MKILKNIKLRSLIFWSIYFAVVTFTIVQWHSRRHPQTIQLIQAIDIGDIEAVRTLINKGARINGRVNNPFHGFAGWSTVTPLEWAREKDREEILLLLKKRGAHYMKPSSQAVFNAVYNSDAEELAWLIDQGEKVTWKDKYDTTLLHYCAPQGNYEVAVLLIENGAPVNAVSKHHQESVLHDLVNKSQAKDLEGALKMVDLLIEHGADPNLKDDEGKTALDLAEENNYPKISEALRKHLDR